MQALSVVTNCVFVELGRARRPCGIDSWSWRIGGRRPRSPAGICRRNPRPERFEVTSGHHGRRRSQSWRRTHLCMASRRPAREGPGLSHSWQQMLGSAVEAVDEHSRSSAGDVRVTAVGAVMEYHATCTIWQRTGLLVLESARRSFAQVAALSFGVTIARGLPAVYASTTSTIMCSRIPDSRHDEKMCDPVQRMTGQPDPRPTVNPRQLPGRSALDDSRCGIRRRAVRREKADPAQTGSIQRRILAHAVGCGSPDCTARVRHHPVRPRIQHARSAPLPKCALD